MTRTVTEILAEITTTAGKLIELEGAPFPDPSRRQHLLNTMAPAAVELADALGDPIEVSAWIRDGDKENPAVWGLVGIDDLTGMAVYETMAVENDGVLTEPAGRDRRRALGIEDEYGIAERGPTVLIRTRPA